MRLEASLPFSILLSYFFELFHGKVVGKFQSLFSSAVYEELTINFCVNLFEFISSY